jgi:hypothetical protein
MQTGYRQTDRQTYVQANTVFVALAKSRPRHAS